MNKKRILIAFIIIIILAGAGVGYVLISNAVKSPAQFVGKYNTTQNGVLSGNIDAFMQKENSGKFCSHIQYGNDDKYVYTWMLCESFEHKGSGVVVTSSGFSIPTRFEYDANTKQITGYKQPEDGSTYDTTLKQIFPTEITIFKMLNDDKTAELESTVKRKFYQSIDTQIPMKLQLVTMRTPEFRNWEKLPSSAGRSIEFKKQNDSYYFAFVTSGSGSGVYEAKCMEVTKLNKVVEIPSGKIAANSKAVDPVTCKGLPEV